MLCYVDRARTHLRTTFEVSTAPTAPRHTSVQEYARKHTNTIATRSSGQASSHHLIISSRPKIQYCRPYRAPSCRRSDRTADETTATATVAWNDRIIECHRRFNRRICARANLSKTPLKSRPLVFRANTHALAHKRQCTHHSNPPTHYLSISSVLQQNMVPTVVVGVPIHPSTHNNQPTSTSTSIYLRHLSIHGRHITDPCAAPCYNTNVSVRCTNTVSIDDLVQYHLRNRRSHTLKETIGKEEETWCSSPAATASMAAMPASSSLSPGEGHSTSASPTPINRAWRQDICQWYFGIVDHFGEIIVVYIFWSLAAFRRANTSRVFFASCSILPRFPA